MNISRYTAVIIDNQIPWLKIIEITFRLNVIHTRLEIPATSPTHHFIRFYSNSFYIKTAIAEELYVRFSANIANDDYWFCACSISKKKKQSKFNEQFFEIKFYTNFFVSMHCKKNQAYFCVPSRSRQSSLFDIFLCMVHHSAIRIDPNPFLGPNAI